MLFSSSNWKKVDVLYDNEIFLCYIFFSLFCSEMMYISISGLFSFLRKCRLTRLYLLCQTFKHMTLPSNMGLRLTLSGQQDTTPYKKIRWTKLNPKIIAFNHRHHSKNSCKAEKSLIFRYSYLISAVLCFIKWYHWRWCLVTNIHSNIE